MSIYLIIVAITLILGAIMPQRGPQRKYYIILMALIQAFVSGFRYNHLTGDLMKYHFEFNNMATYDWFSDDVLHEGRNAGFYLLMKLVNHLTDADFQILLIVIAVIINVVLAYVIYRYSPAPWMSYLVWNCLAFFIFGLSAIKQSLAMAFVMLSFVGIAEKRPKFYLLMLAIAGTIHMPALVFLPAYWLAQMRVNGKTLALYVVLGALLYVFKDQFVSFIRSFYYDDDEVLVYSGEVGSRFIMILGFTLFAVLLKGLNNRDFEKIFHLMAVSTILQLLAGFDNIFTRMTDYYFQFAVLYLPMTFFPSKEKNQRSPIRPMFPFNDRSLKIFAGLIVVFLIWFYWTYSVNVNVSYSVDDYTNFRFMWDVQ